MLASLSERRKNTPRTHARARTRKQQQHNAQFGIKYAAVRICAVVSFTLAMQNTFAKIVISFRFTFLFVSFLYTINFIFATGFNLQRLFLNHFLSELYDSAS